MEVNHTPTFAIKNLQEFTVHYRVSSANEVI